MRLGRRVWLVVGLLAAWTLAGCTGSGPGPDDSPGGAPSTSASAAPALTVIEPGDALAAVHQGRLTRPISVDGGLLRLDPVARVPGDALTEAAEMRAWVDLQRPGWGSALGPVVVFRARASVGIPISPGQTGVAASPPAFRDQDSWVVLWRTRFAYACPAVVPAASASASASVTAAPSAPIGLPLSDLGADLFSTQQPNLAVQYLAYHRACNPQAAPTAYLVGPPQNPPAESDPGSPAADAPTRYYDGSWHPLPAG